MGLDMYLTKKSYVKQWDHTPPEDRTCVLVVKGGRQVQSPFPITHVEYEVGYWRKANQIHNWFESNVVQSEDWHGGDEWVSSEQLKELLQLCKKVKKIAVLKDGDIQNGTRYENGVATPIMEKGKYIENAEEVAKILPTAAGFFFGSTDYDEYYMHDIDNTIEILTKALKDETSGDFYYGASW